MAHEIAEQLTALQIPSSEIGEEIADLGRKVFGRLPKESAFLAGGSRNAFLVDMENNRYVFTKRERKGHARVEAQVLRTLETCGYTPNFVAIAGEWTVQEFLPGTRLSVLLDSINNMAARTDAVALAIEALLNVHAEAEKSGIIQQLPIIGEQRDWIYNRSGAAARISTDIGISPPDIDRDLISDTLFGPRERFIKYDARPGNALIDGDRAYWIDWEDCGSGDVLEDLAFILCDEWNSIDGATENYLIDKFLPFFNYRDSEEEARKILTYYGLVHTVVRLRMALKYRLRDGTWWDRDDCLRSDKVGNTPQETGRLCDRGIRWADQFPELRAFVPWFKEIKGFFEIPEIQSARSQRHAA